MRIGELARRSGVSERMLRYYEGEGLLHPNRTEAGYREYDAGQMEVARHVRMLSDAGLKIASIRVLLPCVLGKQPVFHPCIAGQALLRSEVEKLDARLRELTQTRAIVVKLLNAADANEVLPL